MRAVGDLPHERREGGPEKALVPVYASPSDEMTDPIARENGRDRDLPDLSRSGRR